MRIDWADDGEGDERLRAGVPQPHGAGRAEVRQQLRAVHAEHDVEPVREAASEQEPASPNGPSSDRDGAERGDAGRGDAGRGDADQGDDAGAVRAARSLEYQAKVERAERAYAIDQGCARVKEIEEKTITPAMRRIEAEDPERHLAGLEHRLKGKERLTEKVTLDVEKKGRSVDQAFANVKDAIRYTFVYDEDKYTAGVYADCDRLESAGFERFDRRNSWDEDEYKGINSRWRIPETDRMFEVQFHTQASLDAKEETHWAYERIRSAPDDAEVAQLHAYQRAVTSKVPIPPGAREIPDYRF